MFATIGNAKNLQIIVFFFQAKSFIIPCHHPIVHKTHVHIWPLLVKNMDLKANNLLEGPDADDIIVIIGDENLHPPLNIEWGLNTKHYNSEYIQNPNVVKVQFWLVPVSHVFHHTYSYYVVKLTICKLKKSPNCLKYESSIANFDHSKSMFCI